MGEINKIPGNLPPQGPKETTGNASKETKIVATRVKSLANEHFTVFQGVAISSREAFSSLKGKVQPQTDSSVPKNIKPR